MAVRSLNCSDRMNGAVLVLGLAIAVRVLILSKPLVMVCSLLPLLKLPELPELPPT